MGGGGGEINTCLGWNAADVEAGAAQCGVLLHAHSLHTQLSSLPNTQFSHPLHIAFTKIN
jgi:hypothetical protein